MANTLPYTWAVATPAPGVIARDALTRAAFGLLCVFVFALPWEEQLPVLGVGTIGRLFGLMSIALGALAVFATGRIRRPRGTHLCLIAYVGWVGLSYCWSLAPELTLTRLLTQLQMLGMVWLIWQFAPGSRSQIALLTAYTLGTYVSATATILNYVAGRQSVEPLRYAATGFDPNDLALALALSIPMGLYLADQVKARLPALLFRCHLAVIGFAILLTGSRGVFAAAAAGLAWSCLRLVRASGRVRVSLLLAIPIAAVALLAVPNTTWQRLGTAEESLRRGDLSKRVLIWKAGWEIFPQRPLAGVGAASYQAAIEPLVGLRRNAHNVFLSVLVETGLIGLCLFGAALLALRADVHRMPGQEKALAYALLLIWAVGGLTLHSEAQKPTWFLFGFLAAAAPYARRPW